MFSERLKGICDKSTKRIEDERAAGRAVEEEERASKIRSLSVSFYDLVIDGQNFPDPEKARDSLFYEIGSLFFGGPPDWVERTHFGNPEAGCDWRRVPPLKQALLSLAERGKRTIQIIGLSHGYWGFELQLFNGDANATIVRHRYPENMCVEALARTVELLQSYCENNLGLKTEVERNRNPSLGLVLRVALDH